MTTLNAMYWGTDSYGKRAHIEITISSADDAAELADLLIEKAKDDLSGGYLDDADCALHTAMTLKKMSSEMHSELMNLEEGEDD